LSKGSGPFDNQSAVATRAPGRHVRRAAYGAGVVLLFLLWIGCGALVLLGRERAAAAASIGTMVLTLVMLREHATSVLGLCL
jgi:hypothetical protein